jgi:hypothetical protein
MSSALPPSPSPDSPPAPKGEGRPSNRQKQGQRSWHRRLIAAGRLEEAAEWAAACNLLPPAEPPAAPAQRAAPAALAPAPSGPAPAPQPAALASPTAAALGGEGVSQAGGLENGHTSTACGQILQCESPAGTPAVAAEAHLSLPADSLPLIGASPKGEVEGVGAVRQDGSISGADAEGVKVEECLGGWPAEVEGVVGIRCRNKWYVEVQVGEKKWAKAEIGGRVLTYAERRMVRRVWVSADGRDAEYEFVDRVVPMPVVEPQPEPAVDLIPALLSEESVSELPAIPSLPGPVTFYNPSATDFMEQARNAAYAAYTR